MTEPLTPELERQAQELATRIHSRAADSILAMAWRLVSCSEETLFGQTEFALRDHSHRIVADTEHLEKKVATVVSPTTRVDPAATANALGIVASD